MAAVKAEDTSLNTLCGLECNIYPIKHFKYLCCPSLSALDRIAVLDGTLMLQLGPCLQCSDLSFKYRTVSVLR